MKIIQSILLFLFSLIIFVTYALEVNFDFTAKSHLFIVNTAIPVQLYFEFKNLTQNQFEIRPQTSNGFVNIYDKYSKNWIDGNAYWDSMPKLSKDLEIKIVDPVPKKVDVWFLVRNTKTGEIYETTKKPFWNKKEIYKEYFNALERNIYENAKIIR